MDARILVLVSVLGTVTVSLRHRLWLCLTAVLLVSSSAGAYLVAPLWTAEPLLAVTNWAAIVAFAIVAVLVAEEGGQAGNARLFAASAVCWAFGLLGTRTLGSPPLLECALGPFVFVFVFVAPAVLRYPQARLARPFERVFVLVLLGWLVVARAILTVTSEPTQYDSGAKVWWPALIPSRGLNQLAASVFGLGVALLAVVFLVLIGLRLRRTRGLDRRMLLPVVVAGVAVSCVAGVDALTRLLPHGQPLRAQILTVEPIAMSVIPFAFLIAAVGRRLARAAVADLVLHVGRSGTVEVVRAELRHALCDPSLEVLYWVPEADSYVDAEGRPAKLGVIATDRLVVPVETADRQPLAAVVGDPSLARHRDLVDAAVTASRLALENAWLQARVLSQLEQVRASRARIVEAGLAERRRLERDLHDGAQQRLLALAMQLAALRAHTDDPAILVAVEQACDELSRALQELRDLARGIHPAVLSQAGLASALEGVAERLPLPVELDVPPQRWDPAVESTAYFVACEALANTVKHAAATRARVTVRSQGDDVCVEVADDGSGGADLTPGNGLAGLQDRVAALGGRLSVTSPARAGTRLVATIPCA